MTVVTGVMTNVGGSPVGGAPVTFTLSADVANGGTTTVAGSEFSCVTGADGRFEIDLPPTQDGIVGPNAGATYAVACSAAAYSAVIGVPPDTGRPVAIDRVVVASGDGAVYVQDADPGAVGAGAIWMNTTAPPSGLFLGIPDDERPILVRNAANSGWLQGVLIHRDADGNVRGFVTFQDNGISIEKRDADGTYQCGFVLSDSGLVAIQALGGVNVTGGYVSTDSSHDVTSGKDLTAQGGLSVFLGGGAPSITGSLSTVADAAAKDVLTSIIAVLVAPGLATNGTG